MDIQPPPSEKDGFSIDFTLDEVQQRLVMTLKGQLVSATYLKLCTDYYSQMSDPGRFDRLVDCTASSGYVNFDHLKTLTDLWKKLLSGQERVVNVAIVSNDQLTHARMGMVDQLSGKQRHRAFYTVEDAVTWLDAQRET